MNATIERLTEDLIEAYIDHDRMVAEGIPEYQHREDHPACEVSRASRRLDRAWELIFNPGEKALDRPVVLT